MPDSSYLDINLVKKRLSFTDKFLKWAMSAGRVIVILTEIVALSAFLYRFILDRQLIDLHTQIKQEQAIINFSKPSEDKYRNLQDRLTVAARFSQLEQDEARILKDVLNLTPSTAVINNLTSSDTTIKISASFSQIADLGAFIDSLKSYPSIASVSIDKIENVPSTSLITANITGSLKPNKNSNATTKK